MELFCCGFWRKGVEVVCWVFLFVLVCVLVFVVVVIVVLKNNPKVCLWH